MVNTYKQESLPVTTESALIPDRKESGRPAARKAKVVGVASTQSRGLATSSLRKVSRVGCDVKCGRLNLLGAVRTVAIRWKRQEPIICRERTLFG